MNEGKNIIANWNPKSNLIYVELSGRIYTDDLETFQKVLNETFNLLINNSKFKIIINLIGFESSDFEVHKKFRSILPLLLLDYGWKVGYVDWFKNQTENLILNNKKGIQCVALAHCHHDESKMIQYEFRFSHIFEHYFTNLDIALEWIEGLKV